VKLAEVVPAGTVIEVGVVIWDATDALKEAVLLA
jgi:hypothetical protein